MMSPEEDIYQLYDVQRKFGEQDQLAPVMEETRGFGQIQVQSLLDQEMAKMSPIEDMSYLQSGMHFNESVESNADSDLEHGEIRKLLTSSLCAQGASGRPDAMDTQESEVNAQTSHSSEGREATGRPVALFSPKRNEQRNQTWSSVFGNAIVSNLGETLLEGNKDHLLNRGRTDLARREIHVESPNKCINDLQKERRHKIGHCKKYKTKVLNLVENKQDYIRNYCEKRKLFEILRFKVCTNWKR